MLQNFFEHIINRVYQNCRSLVFFFISLPSVSSSYIKFGGWEMSYNWKGRVRPSRETVGNVEIIIKTVHFNFKYALHLMGVETEAAFTFPYFVRTIAHEIAHCLLLDYDPGYLYIDDPHTELHQMLTKILELYLWTLPEIQELATLQNKTVF